MTVSYRMTGPVAAWIRPGRERWREALAARELSLQDLSGDGFVNRIEVDGRSVVFTALALPLNTAAAHVLAEDKLSTYQVLAACEIRVPAGFAFFGDRYRETALEVGPEARVAGLPARVREVFPRFEQDARVRLVVKPGRGSRGSGVSICRTVAEVCSAADVALRLGHYGIVQEYVPGVEYRVNLLDDELLVGYAKLPPTVVGDGKKTLRELVAELQARIGRVVRVALEAPDRVVPAGERVCLDAHALNLSVGGVPNLEMPPPPAVLDIARRAAAAIGIRYCGVDVRWHEGEAWVLEINGNPSFDVLAQFYPEIGRDIARRVMRAVLACGRGDRG